MKSAVIVFPASNCDRDVAPIREGGHVTTATAYDMMRWCS